MKILLLDRDGTIIRNVPYLDDPEKVELVEDSVPVLRLFADSGYRISIVSNQSGVGRGIISLEQVHKVNARVREILRPKGLQVDYFYFCPHAPWENCRCRKPQTRLIMTILERYRVSNIKDCYLIGDSESDVKAGEAAGLSTIHVRTTGIGDDGKGIEWKYLFYPVRNTLLFHA